MFEWVPRTLSGSLADTSLVGGAHGVDLAGLALGQVLVLSKKVHCMSLSSIHILYYHTPKERLKPNPEPWYGFTYFHCPEVVLYKISFRPGHTQVRSKPTAYAVRGMWLRAPRPGRAKHAGSTPSGQRRARAIRESKKM